MIGVIEVVNPFSGVTFQARLQVFFVVIDTLHLRVCALVNIDVELVFIRLEILLQFS